MKLIEVLRDDELINIIDEFKSMITKQDIFYNLDFLDTNENYLEKIKSYLKRKNNLKNFFDPMFSDMQFNNIAGFELVDSNAGQIHSEFKSSKKPSKRFEYRYDNLKSNELIAQKWHNELIKTLEKLFHSKTKNNITCLNEEWHNYNVKSIEDEFVTLYKPLESKKKSVTTVLKPINIHSKDKKDKKEQSNSRPRSNGGCSIEELSHMIKHRMFQISKNLLVINIHTSSSTNGRKVSEAIFNLLSEYKQKYKDKTIILGGDSNIYYGKFIPGKNDGVSDINYFYSKLKKIGYNLLISRHIVAKFRPYNYFQNAQSASKGGVWTNEETMFIAVPFDMDIEFDNSNYFLFEKNKKIKITDFFKDYRYAFSAVKKNIKMSDINYDNFYNHIYSDHIPVYLDFIFENKENRIIFSNNLSINSSRGINNYMDLFKIKDVKKLESLSRKQITRFVIKKTEELYDKYGIEYIKQKKTNSDSKNIEYLKKTLLSVDFDKLKVNQGSVSIYISKSKKNSQSKSKSKSKSNTKEQTKTKPKSKKTLFQKNWHIKDDCVELY